MSPEKDEELVRKYPMLYAQRQMNMRETCMCWGFETGDGWFQVIDELSAKIEALNQKIKAYNEASGEKERKKHLIEAVQVKEKFGSLRFYLGPVPDEHYERVYKWIDEAEEVSGRTCEACGKPGRTRPGGWVVTLCDDCHEERQKSR